MQMTGFKLRISRVGSDRSNHWATTTSQEWSFLCDKNIDFKISKFEGHFKEFIWKLIFLTKMGINYQVDSRLRKDWAINE